ncbi:probable basic-leucine zipper transcription factor E [Teleopsis dalmanni]|uniref:probable basic-leucine zipper transcription factor E n=1 Tax=Teleopsis dalmanni TaxID=139649 RepID=UPI0018CF0436|nr:probable basic-leucine zipper transcription factor E [Teleopsis dalmanni]
MTTTISKHDLQLQQQQQQQTNQQQQQQRSSLLYKNFTNTSYTINNINKTTLATPTTSATTYITSGTDNATFIQIDSLNNNTNSLVSTTLAANESTTIAINNNNGTIDTTTIDTSIDISSTAQTKTQKRCSLLNFKSFDFNIKSLYSGLRSSNKTSQTQSTTTIAGNANGSSGLITDTPTGQRTPAVNNRMPPYLKIEAVDTEESENLLLDYPQSPYSSRRNSSQENRSSTQLLHISHRMEDMSRSQASSPSPYFLSPYVYDMATGGNIRRSSTSDIQCKRSGSSSGSDSRRPSTSDLLRKARERRGSEARMGRSVSHAGLPRGAFSHVPAVQIKFTFLIINPSQIVVNEFAYRNRMIFENIQVR